MAIPLESKPNLVLGVSYAEQKDDAPPGLVWRKVKAGETLGKIADEYGIHWIDLALYNWNTSEPKEINWYLHHFVGCTKNNGMTYSFTGQEKADVGEGGWLLVPDLPPDLKKGPPRAVAAVRNGSATLDTKLQVEVVDWRSGGNHVPVTGKWLYVFSGNGVDFGQKWEPKFEPRPNSDAMPGPEPNTAFKRAFPGMLPIANCATKLEYEIMITASGGPSAGLRSALTGLNDEQGDPYYKPGSNWYFLSGPALNNAAHEGRDKRTTHAFRNIKLVTVDLKQNKRYYFLLSPVQLGPVALQYAMANSQGLTPLLAPGMNGKEWDPDNPLGPSSQTFIGPTVDDIKKNPIRLPVVDPYAWAEDLERRNFQHYLGKYVEWLGINSQTSDKNQTIGQLTAETGWTLDHLYIAQILKAVRDHYPDPKKIDKQLKDAAKWKSDLEKWDTQLTQRDAEINANAHRSLIQLIDWLNGPGHTIIETAILKDANISSLQDAIDVARGVVHWADCTEHMVVLEPGVAYLREMFSKPGSVPTDVVIHNLSPDGPAVKITETGQIGLRLGLPWAIQLMALKDFTSPPPNIGAATRRDYLISLAEFQAVRRDKLIKLWNDSNIASAEFRPAKLDPTLGPTGGVLLGAAVANAFLDVGDKITNYVCTKKSKHTGAASLEEYVQARKALKGATLTLNYSLKSLALFLNGWNLYNAITTARYDYQTNQMTVGRASYLQSIAGATAAVQDVLAEVGNLAKSQLLQNIFPQYLTTGGSHYHFEGKAISSTIGRNFARLNALAMIIVGVTTMITMDQSYDTAHKRGDYTAATLYKVGYWAGGVMAVSGLSLGLSLMEVGGIFTSTGAGVFIGVVFFAVGSIVAAIASFVAWKTSSDEYEVFARKCFLGSQGNEEPRFGSDPDSWTNAAPTGADTWPLDKQKRAIHNLLGRFSVKTSYEEMNMATDLTPTIRYEITPRLFKPWCSLEVAMHYQYGGPSRAVAKFVWNPGAPDTGVTRPVERTVKGIFDPERSSITFLANKDFTVNSIHVFAGALDYDLQYGKLLTTVTVCYPDLPNVIRTRKFVMEGYHRLNPGVGVDFPIGDPTYSDGVDVDSNTEESELFE